MTLVLVQVGLFMGLLAKATVTIEHASADIWVTSKNTPNVDFAHTFPETAVLRVRGVPGVERADNLIVQFMNIQLPNGAEEGCLVYALEDFRGLEPALERPGRRRGRPQARAATSSWTAPRSGASAPSRSATTARSCTAASRSSAPPRRRASFTTAPIVFMDYGNAQERSEILQGRTPYVLVKTAPGRRRAGGGGGDPPAPALQRRPHARRVGAQVAHATGWSPPASGMNMGVTVFLGILVGIVVVAQTLYTSAVEHVKEFGTVKAIGGSNWDIYRILGEQALIAAVVGFVAGRRSSRWPCGR